MSGSDEPRQHCDRCHRPLPHTDAERAACPPADHHDPLGAAAVSENREPPVVLSSSVMDAIAAEDEALRAELAETRAALGRARDTAALLESELAGAVVPQVLTAETPEPPRPWRVVPTWDVDQDWTSEGAADVKTWAQAVSTAATRPVFVISARAGDDRG